jgi:hypothetical protein
MWRCAEEQPLFKTKSGEHHCWEYTVPPYIESGEELYNDLTLAYDNGAKCIVVFDSNEAYTQGILKEEHLQALKQFGQYAQANPRQGSQSSGRTAFVLPRVTRMVFVDPAIRFGVYGRQTIFFYQLCKRQHATGTILN